MKILTVDPESRSDVSLVADEIGRLLDAGKQVTVAISEKHETVSPQQAADRLGFSRQHVMRLIENGSLEAEQLPGSAYWQIPVGSVDALQKRREEGRRIMNEWSRNLDALGAPLE